MRTVVAICAGLWLSFAAPAVQAGSFNEQGRFEGEVSPLVTALLAKYPLGGAGLTAEMAALLEADYTLADDVVFALRSVNAEEKRSAAAGLAEADRYFVTCMTSIFPPTTATDRCREGDRRIRWAMRFADPITLAAFQAAPGGNTSGETTSTTPVSLPGGGTCVSPSSPACP